MSEFTNARDNRKEMRWQLLATASAIALIGSAYGTRVAAEGVSDHPTIWIELGGQLSHLENGQEAFAPTLMAGRPAIFSPSQKLEKLPIYSFDEEGKILLQPESSDWVFSASVRFGRSGKHKHLRQQTHPAQPPTVPLFPSIHKYPAAAKFADTDVHNNEHHLIVDFQAGKEVGLGMFGVNGSSVLNLGIRFAQFTSKTDIALKSDPDWHFSYKYYPSFKITQGQPYHSNAASLLAKRSFHGVGPSISWNASTPVAGNSKDGEISFDWGANGSLLFGRQRGQVLHQTTQQYRAPGRYSLRQVVGTPISVHHTRVRSVAVPNVGGFAGISFRMQNFKASAGYRADFFFGADDGGLDTRNTANVGFHGPYATIAIGLGG